MDISNRAWLPQQYYSQNRNTYSVPSKFLQTLVAKALFEHGADLQTIAAVSACSSRFHNGSLGPNLASIMLIDDDSYSLFPAAFDPTTSHTMQFTHHISIFDAPGWIDDNQQNQQNQFYGGGGGGMWGGGGGGGFGGGGFGGGRNPEWTRTQQGGVMKQVDASERQRNPLRRNRYAIAPLQNFLKSLRATKYFHKSLTRLSLTRPNIDMLSQLLLPDALGRKFENLEIVFLYIVEKFLSDDVVDMLNNSSARSIAIQPSYDVTDAAFLNKVSTIRNLHAIEISANKKIGQQALINFFATAKNLTNLVIRCNPNSLDGPSFEALCENLVNLTSLDISLNRQLVAQGNDLTSLAKLTNLTFLSCGNCNIGDAAVRAMAEAGVPLRDLNASQSTSLTFDIAPFSFPAIEILELGCCDALSVEGFRSIAASGRRLRRLQLHYATGISDAHVAELKNTMPCLSTLCLARPIITDAGVLSIGRNLGSTLEYLSIDECENITDFIPSSFSCDGNNNIPLFPRLTRLGLISDQTPMNLTNDAFTRISIHCPNLQSLTVDQRFSDQQLEIVATSMKKLSEFMILRSSVITPEAIATFIPLMEPTLRKLQILNCNKVGRQDADDLKKKCPFLREIIWDQE